MKKPAKSRAAKFIKSPIKYAGGKGWLVPMLVKEINELRPTRYIEPFVGGGSIALNVEIPIKVIGDTNPMVIDMWRCLKDAPGALIQEQHRVEREFPNSPQGYANARDAMNAIILIDRRLWIRRAALFLYLNARCFNGLWRTNAKGTFNVPYGKRKRPVSLSAADAKRISVSLMLASVHLGSYLDLGALSRPSLLKGAAIYADPPYHETFTDYTKESFDEDDQRNLADRLRWCASKGAMVWATNNDTPLIREIYSWARVEPLEERHVIGATGDRRGKRACVLIRGGF